MDRRTVGYLRGALLEGLIVGVVWAFFFRSSVMWVLTFALAWTVISVLRRRWWESRR
ncbi:hypothetical protein RN607_00985 [Demequina capsici]|uniref:Uncharacterized protein n=1 Tax=Demequina capsici TaxID=3075620 RepID=A0AA96FC48_9MICO|nr:hypothetical protein [Demequina sp. PMTSA13]WNM27609.1 hypothetical protein RN607_00985 [Demequina sp. PMTSA13]